MREIARLPMIQMDGHITFTIITTQTREYKQNWHTFLQEPQKSKEDYVYMIAAANKFLRMYYGTAMAYLENL